MGREVDLAADYVPEPEEATCVWGMFTKEPVFSIENPDPRRGRRTWAWYRWQSRRMWRIPWGEK